MRNAALINAIHRPISTRRRALWAKHGNGAGPTHRAPEKSSESILSFGRPAIIQGARHPNAKQFRAGDQHVIQNHNRILDSSARARTAASPRPRSARGERGSADWLASGNPGKPPTSGTSQPKARPAASSAITGPGQSPAPPRRQNFNPPSWCKYWSGECCK